MKMKLMTAALIMILALPCYATDVRTPVIRAHSVTTTLRPTLNKEDTYTIDVDGGSFLIAFQTDTEVYLATKADSLVSQGWTLLGGQYYPDPNTYLYGDTIVVKCKKCSSLDTATVQLRIYRAGENRGPGR